MKKFLSVIVVSLILCSGLPAGMAGTAQAVTPVIGIGSGGGMFSASGGSVSGGIVVNVPSLPASGGSNAVTISQEQALAVARGIFPDLGSKDINAQLLPSQPLPVQPSKSWILSWSEPAGLAGPNVRMNEIQIDAASGAIEGFQIFDWQADQTGSPLITRDEALQKAEAFIKQYHPEELAQAVLSNTVEPNFSHYKTISFTDNFHWDRMEQGIPVLSDGIQVGVDPFSGRIESCSFNWHTGVAFPASTAIDAAGKAQLLDQFGVIPCYQVQPGQLNAQGVPEASLVYRFNCSSGLQIDPASGSALSIDGKSASLQDSVMIPGPAPVVSSAIYDNQSVVAPTPAISQQAAESKADSFFRAMALSGKAIASGSSNCLNGVFNDKTWEYSLQSEWLLPRASASSRRIGAG